jgi:uncharacterized membrane protein
MSEIMKSFHVSTIVQCCNGNKDCEEAIVEQIAAKHHKTSEVQESEEDNTTQHERVTKEDARMFIAGMRLYFMQP